MKISLLYEIQMPKPWTERTEYEKYWETLAQIKLADEVGFDTVWEVEHHFLAEYSHSPAPEVFLSAVSQHTRRIRLGHGVVLLPFAYNHPIRVAERIAALDIMSNGRVEFGTGRSATEIEMGGFSIPPDETREMWEEGLEVVLKAWKMDPLVHEGKRLKIPPRTVVPKPIQKPHPPIWMAATGPDSFTLAGSLGLGALCFNFTEQQVVTNQEKYRRAIAQAKPVGDFVNNQFSSVMVVHCGTDEETKTVGVEGARWFLQKVTDILITALQMETKSYAYLKEMIDLGHQPKDASVEELTSHPFVAAGDPEHCIRKIERFQKLGVDQLICFMQAGRIPHQRIMDSIRLMGKYVIPYFKPGQG
jgi:alkanesulfonate monooxygenase SsuD/methylene tetrahydromethanopterin reductase-like flavin-dependent oxidoreductase (luciferase family)